MAIFSKVVCVCVLALAYITVSECAGSYDYIFSWFGSTKTESETKDDRTYLQENVFSAWIDWLSAAIGFAENKKKEPTPHTYFQQLGDRVLDVLCSTLHIILYALNVIFISVIYGICAIYSAVTSVFVSLIQVLNVLHIILLLICLLATGVFIYFWRRSPLEQYTKVKSRLQNEISRQRTSSVVQYVEYDNHYKWIIKGSLFVIIGAALLSIPWEFVRLYQIEQAKRAAVVYAGLPPDCDPHKLNPWQSLKAGILWYFSWTDHNHCEKYYHAVLVDPLSEVTPLVVLSSVLTRCVLRPLEMISDSLGKSVKLFFSQIPGQWQPIFIVIILLSFLTVLLMTCRYRIRLPMFLMIEPRTPTNNHVQRRRPVVIEAPTANRVENKKSRDSITTKPRGRKKKQFLVEN